MICVFFHIKLTRKQIAGAIISFLGMAVVVLNGQFVLNLSPLGDMLAFAACLCWAVYSVVARLVIPFYSTLFINRKIFFYGLLTIAPIFAFFPDQIPLMHQLMMPQAWGNLLFLSIVASFLCYCLWTLCIKKLG
ncbi:MAG: DMT family transporter, partial [Bacteroidaceae bacterium]|nr:DMT family transporter [Bacteroidaceae bacterium]